MMQATASRSSHARSLLIVGGASLGLLLAAGVSVADPRFAVAGALVFLVAALAFMDTPRALQFTIVGLVVVPFLSVASIIRPDQVSYMALFTVVSMVVATVAVVRAERIPLDGTIGFLVLVVVTGLAAHGVGTVAANLTWFAPPLAALALYITVVLARQQLGYVLVLLLALMMLEALIGVAQSFLGRPVFAEALPVLYESGRGYLGRIAPGVSTGVTHASGTFSQFNHLGALLVLGLPIAFAMYRSSPSLRRLALMLTLATGVVLTYSRAALLGSVLGCVLVYLLDRRSQKWWIPIAVSLAVALGAIGYQSLQDYQAETGNVTARTATWRYALDAAAQDSPRMVFGYGYHYFQTDVLGDAPAGALPRGVQRTIHSAPLQVLLETGVVGFVLFLVAMPGAVVLALRRRRDAATIALSGSVTGFLVSQAFDNALLSYEGVVMAVLLGLLVRAARTEDPSIVGLFASRGDGNSAPPEPS